jgi:alpha-keto-acid decarboxylase
MQAAITCSCDMQVHERRSFFASALYATVGFAVPAALGAAHASPRRRAIVLVGDGGFQMTGLEVSTHAACRLGTIVIVFNNGGFSTERVLLEGSFNDIAPRYDRVGALVDGSVHGTNHHGGRVRRGMDCCGQG